MGSLTNVDINFLWLVVVISMWAAGCSIFAVALSIKLYTEFVKEAKYREPQK